ncbi:MAG: hypothetical protein PUP91_24585 [Rhizonema sp. PD37]|nr:hypothetical protein [Rhizonema sp. PD37]
MGNASIPILQTMNPLSCNPGGFIIWGLKPTKYASDETQWVALCPD